MDTIEAVAIDIDVGNVSNSQTDYTDETTVILVYSPPSVHESNAYNQLLAEFVCESFSVNYRCCLVGGCNILKVDWENGAYPLTHEYTNVCGVC